MKPELKPCPFCGAEADFVANNSYSKEEQRIERERTLNGEFAYYDWPQYWLDVYKQVLPEFTSTGDMNEITSVY